MLLQCPERRAHARLWGLSLHSFQFPAITIVQYVRRPFDAWATPIHFAPGSSRLARCPEELAHCLKVPAKSAWPNAMFSAARLNWLRLIRRENGATNS